MFKQEVKYSSHFLSSLCTADYFKDLFVRALTFFIAKISTGLSAKLQEKFHFGIFVRGFFFIVFFLKLKTKNSSQNCLLGYPL